MSIYNMAKNGIVISHTLMEKIKRFLFKNTTARQTIAKNTFWIALSTTLVKVTRAVVIIYAARLLGTEGYGLFTYATSIVAICAIFSDMGLTNILTRDLATHTEKKPRYLATTLVVKLAFLLFVVFLVALTGPFISKFEGASRLMNIVVLSVALESLRSFFYAITRSESKMEKEAGLNIASEVISTIIILVVFLKNPTPYSLAIAYLIGNTIGFLITLISLRTYLRDVPRHIDTALMKPIIQSAWPFTIMGIFGVFMTNIDSVIIGAFTDTHTLGLYAAAQRPINLLYILPGFFSVSLFPLLAKALKDNEHDKITHVTEKASLFALAIALPLVSGGILIAKPLINVVYGYAYIGAVSTFQILLLALVVVFPGVILSDVIFVKNKQKMFIKASLIGAIANVVLDLLLIPRYGIAGSAVATLCAQIIMNGMFFSEITHSHSLRLFSGLKNILIATVLMSLVTYACISLSLSLIYTLCMSSIIYTGILFIRKEPLINDIRTSFHI
mgnify:CR=1 FL=1